MLLATIACVLAIVVPLAVGLVLRTSVQNALARMELRLFETYSGREATLMTWSAQHNERVATLADRIKVCELGLTRTEGTHLQGELAALDADVKALAVSVRRQFGRVFAELHQDGALARNASTQANAPLAIANGSADPELDAMLELQRAK